MTGRFTEEQLTFRGGDISWCLPPTFLSRSCRIDRGGFVANDGNNGGIDNNADSSYYDPYNFLFDCLNNFTFTPFNEVEFYYTVEQWKVTNEPFFDIDDNDVLSDLLTRNPIVIVEEVIGESCSLLQGLRSIEGILCLHASACNNTEPLPSSFPSTQPSTSIAPSLSPSSAPSTGSPSASTSSSPSSVPTDVTPSPVTTAPTPYSPSISGNPPGKNHMDLQVEILMRIILTNVTKDLTIDDEGGDAVNNPDVELFGKAVGNGIHNFLIEKQVFYASNTNILIIESMQFSFLSCSHHLPRLPFSRFDHPTTSQSSILEKMEGHLKVNIVVVKGFPDLDLSNQLAQPDALREDTYVSVIVKFTAIYKCFDFDNDDCDPSTVSNRYISSYKETLSNGAISGELAQKIVEFAFILDVEELFQDVSIDPDSVGILSSSKTIHVDNKQDTSGIERASLRTLCFFVVFVTVTLVALFDDKTM